MSSLTNLSGLKTAELLAIYNGVSGKPPVAKWKSKTTELVARILKLKPDLYFFEATAPSERMTDFEAPADELASQKGRPVDHAEASVPATKKKPAKKATTTKKAKADSVKRGAIREECEKLLLKVKGTDVETKRPLGLPYSEILAAVQAKFPEAETSLNCLRWYATKLNKQTGKEKVVMPVRPKAVAVAA